MTETARDRDDLPGTFVFTGERSRAGYRLNKLAMSMTDPANRKAFLAFVGRSRTKTGTV